MKRQQWLDIAKGIAILTVVIGHVSIIPWEPYRKIIFSFHMPLFFIAAGYTAKAEISWKSIKKSAKRLMAPYILSCLIMGAVGIFEGNSFGSQLMRILWGNGVPADYGPGVPMKGWEGITAVGAIWFLPCMFFSRLFFCAVLTATKTLNEYMRATIILILCICGYWIGQRYKLPMCVDVALFNLVFLYAGYLFRNRDGINKKCVSLGVVLLLLWNAALKRNGLELSARFYREFPMCIFTTVGAIAACFLIFYVSNEVLCKVKYIESLLSWCGKNSLAILLIHHFDGIIWESSWFTTWLPDTSSLPTATQGFIIGGCQIMIYLIVCMVYVLAKKQWKQLLAKRLRSVQPKGFVNDQK